MLLALALSCSSGGSGAAPTPGPCVSRRAPIGPDVATSLRTEDRGVTLCLKVGERFSVFLNAPPTATDLWSKVDSSRSKVLHNRSTGQVTLARGVTAAIFEAAKPGTTELSSVRPPCAGPHAGCDPDHAWTAIVLVTR